jgi:hypothetical protein
VSPQAERGIEVHGRNKRGNKFFDRLHGKMAGNPSVPVTIRLYLVSPHRHSFKQGDRSCIFLEQNLHINMSMYDATIHRPFCFQTLRMYDSRSVLIMVPSVSNV